MIRTMFWFVTAVALAVPAAVSARAVPESVPKSASAAVSSHDLALRPSSATEEPLSIGGDGEFRRKMLDWSSPASGEPAPRIGSGSGFVRLANPLERMQPSSVFGIRSDPIDGMARYHAGIDVPEAAGAPVHAAADGIVIRAGWASGYGNLVAIRHADGLETRYGHLSRLIAQTGQAVHRGQIVGLVGETGRATGNHLHFEVRVFGRAADPQEALRGMLTLGSVIVLPDEPMLPVVTHWTGWTRDADRLPASRF